MKATLFTVPIDGQGSLSITPRPRGGEWLEDDVGALAQQGVSVLVSLLCEDEQAQLGLEREAEVCAASNVEFIPLPVPDMCVPDDASHFIAAVHRLARLVREGSHIAAHCRQSIGRSGVLAVSIAIACGTSLETALDVVSAARGVRVPETNEQRDWLRRNSDRLSTTAT